MMESLITLLLNLLKYILILWKISKNQRMLINILLTTRHLETNQRTHLGLHAKNENIHLLVNLWMRSTRPCCKTNSFLHWTTLILMISNHDHHGGMQLYFANTTRTNVIKAAIASTYITKFKT